MTYTLWKGKPGVPGNQVAQANSLKKAREARDAELAKDPQAALSISRFCIDEGDDESGHYEESYDLVLSEESVNKPDKWEPAPAQAPAPDEVPETPAEVLVSGTWIPARLATVMYEADHAYYGCAMVFMDHAAYKAAKGTDTKSSCGWLLDQRPEGKREGEIKCIIKPEFWRHVGVEKAADLNGVGAG